MRDGDDTFGDPASAPDGEPETTGALPASTPPDPATTWPPTTTTAAPLPPPPPAPAGPVPPPTSDPSTWVLPAGPPPAPLPYGPSTTAPPPGWAPPATPGAGTPPPPPPGAPAWSAPGAGSPPPPPPGWSPPLPIYGAAPPPPPHAPATKGRSRAALAILSVTAVLAATTFAVVALTRPDGSASAEEAVENLFDALEQEDAIGVMESLPPGEREVLLDPMVATVGELQRLGLLGSFALEDVPGADIEVEGLTLQSTNLGPGVTKVRVTGGTITGTVIPDEVPIGPRARELAERESGEPIEIAAESDTESLADSDLELVAIEEGGGWHVSLFYSIAEGARGDDQPLPEFGSGAIVPIGADTPEGAVRGLLEAGLALDLGRAVGHLPPDEMRVLYDYVPLVLDDADEAADEVRDDGYQASLDRLDLHSEGDGDTRRVTVDALDVTAGTEESNVHYAWDGTCTVMEMTEPRYERFAPVDPDTGELGDPEPATPSTTRAEICAGGTVTFTEDGEDVGDEFYDLGPVGAVPFGTDATLGQAVTVVEHDGRWYVSPVRTVSDSVLGALRKLEGEDIDRFFESFGDWWSSPSERFEPVGEPIPGPSGTIPLPDPDDPYTVCAEVYDDLDPDATDDEWEAANDAYDQCLLDRGVEALDDPSYFDDPAIVGGHVLVPSDEHIVGYGLDGSVAFDGPACAYGSFLSTTIGTSETIAVARCDDDELVAVDGTSGAELWRRPVDVAAVVAVGPDAVVVMDGATMTVLDLQSGAERWSELIGDVQNYTLDDGAVYLDDGATTVAHDLASGAVRWAVPMEVTMLDTVPGALMAGTDDGLVHRLDPATGTAVWSTGASSAVVGRTGVAGATADVVVITSIDKDNQLWAFDRESGELLWTRSGVDTFVRPVAGATSVVVTDFDTGESIVVDHRTGEVEADIVLPDTMWARDIEGAVLAGVGLDDDDVVTVTTVLLP